MAHSHTSRTALPWFLLPISAVLLAAAAVTGAWLFGRKAPLQPHERPADRSGGSEATVCGTFETFSAPLQAETESAPAYDYREILFDEDGILIARIEGKRYKGVLAVVDDPTRLFVGSIPWYGEEGYGWRLDRMMEHYGAVLGLNGGGFDDTVGQGRGGSPQGIVMCEGRIWLGGEYGSYDVCAFTDEGRLITGRRTGKELLEAGVHSAVSFGPALIVDGAVQEFDYKTLYWEPRSLVGQREDGSILLMALEGRQAAALGADFPTAAQAMLDFGAINATNLDGGASSSLLYKGELINICNSVGGLRAIPTGILVRSSAGEEAGE